MSEWKEVKLGDVANYYIDKIDQTLVNENNYITTDNILPNKCGKTKANSIPDIKKHNAFKENQILISNIRPYFKKILFSKYSGGCSSDILVFEIGNKCCPLYMYYILSQDSFFDFVMTGSKGTKMPRGDKTHIMSFNFLLPPLPEQKRIASILSSLDDKIELNNKMNKTLEKIAETLFKEWFVNFNYMNEEGKPYKDSGGEMVSSELGDIPAGWRVGTLGDVIDFYNGYSFKSNQLLNNEIEDSYHVFKMGHIKKGGGFNSGATKSWVEKSKFSNLTKYVLKDGDLLMCMTDMKGNVALLGHTALIDTSDKYIVNQRVGLIRPNNEFTIGNIYLYLLTNSTDFIEDLRSRANSGVQVNLTTEEIKKSKIVVAPKELNAIFEKTATPIFKMIFKLSSQNQKLTEIRDSLLPKLMSGEIRV